MRERVLFGGWNTRSDTVEYERSGFDLNERDGFIVRRFGSGLME